MRDDYDFVLGRMLEEMEREPWAVMSTTAELITEARERHGMEMSPRTITKWTEDGLLNSPIYQKSTQRGSDPRAYDPMTRILFHLLLPVYRNMRGRRVLHYHLADITARIWLMMIGLVGDEQSVRMWSTWAAGRAKAVSGESERKARAMIQNMADPAATRAQRATAKKLLYQTWMGMHDPEDAHHWEMLESALMAIRSPFTTMSGKRIERPFELGTYLAGVPELVLTMKLGQQVLALLRERQVSSSVLNSARRRYRRLVEQDELIAERWDADAVDHPYALGGSGPVPMVMDVNELEGFLAVLCTELGLTNHADGSLSDTVIKYHSGFVIPPLD
ncbi:hypothetical protein [Streptomyces sp. NPDC006645]|uniref:hypothetical protein n=1 Tax=unclassified Streptomyces TaxID=2593676 RepID=UPI0033A2CD8D